jgi:hypothetical protein
MLDPTIPTRLDLTDFETYQASCQDLANERLAGLTGLAQADSVQADLNRYPRLRDLDAAQGVRVLEDVAAAPGARERAVHALLAGHVLLEHACAGEATRLGLGSKYLLNPGRDFTPGLLTSLLPEGKTPALDPASLAPLSLGSRHMLQLAWDLWHLAQEAGHDPQETLQRQHLLVITNQASAQAIQDDFRAANFYGFGPQRVLFMTQRAFPGLALCQGGWEYDPASPRRLHNHGQMLLQTTMENQVFRLDLDGRALPLTWPQFHDLLETMEDKVSFNIEDLDYLDRSLDFLGLAAALELGREGAAMVMEVVTNDPINPIKGGACFLDTRLGRTVVIESFQLKGLTPRDLRLLNKNVNHYPNPSQALATARQRGLSMPIAVKGEHVYFQPVQGDLNFLLPTAFVGRRRLKPIRAWKSPANTNQALKAMAAQDTRPGFLAWAAELTGLALK